MNFMLKKKALTVILTAALVFGIGGISTDTFNVHEHELGIAHAANPFSDQSVTPAKSANKVAYWRCYWCGKTANTSPYNSGAQTPRAYPPSSSGPCVAGHQHGWVWTGGISPYLSQYEVLYCPQCKKVHKKLKNGVSAPQKGCSGNKGSYHHWNITGIVVR